MADNHDLVASLESEKKSTGKEQTLSEFIDSLPAGTLITQDEIDQFKQLDYRVYPSEKTSISVQQDDEYGGAHLYAIKHAKGFENGEAVEGEGLTLIQFVQKPGPEAETIEGLQSEQLAFVILDRCEKLNKRFPSPHNEKQLAGIKMFIEGCEDRVKSRIKSGVMGKLQADPNPQETKQDEPGKAPGVAPTPSTTPEPKKENSDSAVAPQNALTADQTATSATDSETSNPRAEADPDVIAKALESKSVSALKASESSNKPSVKQSETSASASTKQSKDSRSTRRNEG